MGPGIGHSIKEGFAAATRSWAGIGVFAVAWVAAIALAIGVVALTRPPAALFQELPAPQEPVVPSATLPAPSVPENSPTTPEQTDVFNQLSAPGDTPTPAQLEATAQLDAVAQPPAAPDPLAARREEVAERDRLAGEWFGRAWPLLLVCLLFVMAANLWLNGGQIGYLAQQVIARQAAVSAFWSVGGKTFGALIGGTLLSLGGLAAATLVGVLLATALAAIGRVSPGWVSTLIAVIGVVLALCGVAALVWLLVRLSFWFIAIVVERLGPIAALKRSVRITQGRWWPIAGLGLLMGLISYAVWLPFGLLEWIGNQIGGGAAAALGITGNILGFVASLFVGFAMLAAYIRFYEDAKAGASS